MHTFNLPTRFRSWNKQRKPSKESGIFVIINLALVYSKTKTKGGIAWHNVSLNSLLPRSFRLGACERIISYFFFFNTFIIVDLATVFMLEKSLSSSSLQMTFTEVKCMIRMMYVAITRRGSGGRLRPPANKCAKLLWCKSDIRIKDNLRA